ncbi:MAG: Rrf2 family transcriptional regulator [Moheibacter sp.]
MIFSYSCQYAIKSCIYLANKNAKVGVGEISDFIGSPIPFTSKILQKLAKAGVISSSKGRAGGFYLSEVQQKSLSIKDIYLVIDNGHILNACALGISECSDVNPCPVHYRVVEIKETLNEILTLKIKDIKEDGKIRFH